MAKSAQSQVDRFKTFVLYGMGYVTKQNLFSRDDTHRFVNRYTKTVSEYVCKIRIACYAHAQIHVSYPVKPITNEVITL